MFAPWGREDCPAVSVAAAGGAEVIDDMIARSKAVARARTSLADARVELDSAVSSLSNGMNEKVMASSEVVDLLVRVVAARRHLEDLERGAGGSEAGSRA